MSCAASTRSCAARFGLHFVNLFNSGKGFLFPCDAEGHVDMDALTRAERTNYLFARAMVGRDFLLPAVRRQDDSCDGIVAAS